MEKFFKNAGEEVDKTGHILESTEVTMLTNWPSQEKITIRTRLNE